MDSKKLKYSEQFKEIREFLGDHDHLSRFEILNDYPAYQSRYEKSWLDKLKELSEEELYQVDTFGNPEVLKDHPMGSWLKRIKELTALDFEKLDNPKELPDWAFNKVKFKKRYEILKIGEWITHLKKKEGFSHLVDIGGGVGHLARVLSHYFGIETISLDANKTFQDLGKKRMNKYPRPEGAKELSFINMFFGADLKDEKDNQILEKVFSKEAISLGLHTCGPLAIGHMKTNLKFQTKGLLNFGCCYNKLDPLLDVNISEFAKKNPLAFNQFALTLATRGHCVMDLEEFRLKRTVKKYRYGLHLFLLEHEQTGDFLSVGEAHVKLYKGPFSDYLRSKYKEIGLTCSYDEEYINHFLEREDIKETLEEMFLCNVIRWQIGRVVEFYLLIDRALYLQEHDQEVELKQFFDEVVSPRNIGLFSLRKSEPS
ncbi:methyltransferase [Halobacteriovorax sp. GB3]|uniref:methyltransferase n=1 Tax=Halobacteriovorax sp. GB3 TaxID=2719615 RepID=UPI00236199B8|nr:methyltransferase [Halobacteriovorax sp. GB3]MDD0852317.1 methyltransferase [Halobacteriovorax sp. GB3]